VTYVIEGRAFETQAKPGKLPFFGFRETHWVAPSHFRELSHMKFAFTDLNSDRHFAVSVDLLLLKELGKSEGW